MRIFKRQHPRIVNMSGHHVQFHISSTLPLPFIKCLKLKKISGSSWLVLFSRNDVSAKKINIIFGPLARGFVDETEMI